MKEIVLDTWSWYDYKSTFKNNTQGWKPPAWVGEHQRRLRAYALLDSYCHNSARNWLDPTVEEAVRESRREYGDPDIIVETALASLLGDDMSIVVPESDKEGASDAKAQFDLLQIWKVEEIFDQKVMECERKSVRLGDGVYVLNWDSDVERPRLTVYDPSYYFPVLDQKVVGEQFPKKVHVGWEYQDEEKDSIRYVRRLTWEMVDLVDLGLPTRQHPWNKDGKPAKVTCVYKDKTWLLENAEGTIQDLNEAKGVSNLDGDLEELDLNIDFLPVIHVPNTIAGDEHFGQSVLARVGQVCDDIVMNDTDLMAASRTTGTPPIALSGSSAPKNEDGTIQSYGPGTVFETGDGSATMIDTSRSLDALLKFADHLRSTLAVNGRTPESLLGRVKPNEVPSGIALTLSFSPHSHMIREMRTVRDAKYGLLLKFVSRFYRANSILSGQVFPCGLKFGSYLPADKQETSTVVTQLYREDRPLISLKTALVMMVNAGFPIEDAVEELKLINSTDFKAANQALDASGDINFARSLLGLPPLDPNGLAVPPFGGPLPPGPGQ